MPGFGPVTKFPVASVSIGRPGVPSASAPLITYAPPEAFNYRRRRVWEYTYLGLNVCLLPVPVLPPANPATTHLFRYKVKSVGDVWPSTFYITPPTRPPSSGFNEPLHARVSRSRGDVWASGTPLLGAPSPFFNPIAVDSPIRYRSRTLAFTQNGVLVSHFPFAYLLFASL